MFSKLWNVISHLRNGNNKKEAMREEPVFSSQIQDTVMKVEELTSISEKDTHFQVAVEEKTSNTNKNWVDFDVLDVSTAIDISAEIEAVEAYEELMRTAWEWWMFKKVWWFFKKSFYRMWRDAWIESKKRQIIKWLNDWLKKGEYTHASLEAHVRAWIEWVANKAYLQHEEITTNVDVSVETQKVIDEWIDIDPKDNNARNQKLQELKSILEQNYPITTDLSQLEISLIKLERAKIQWELETLQAKMNVLDIGRIEHGYWKRKRSFIVDIFSHLETKNLPKWMKWFIQHPNTAAVASALVTRWAISGTVATWAVLWFASWLLAPVALWAAAWWVLAYWRAKREVKDRNAQLDRRWAVWLITWTQETDGRSLNHTSKPENYQHSVMDLYNQVLSAVGTNDQNLIHQAFEAWTLYLVKHKVWRIQSLNMLRYDTVTSVSSQHVKMIQLLNQVFPWFVSDFNNWVYFDFDNNTKKAQWVRDTYQEIYDLSEKTITYRNSEEKKYAIKQWLVYAWVAATVWGVIWSVASILTSSWSSVAWWEPTHLSNSSSLPVPLTPHTYYPDELHEYHVKRNFWYDNATAAPKFDHTELMIHTNKSGWWNITSMLWKTPFTNGHSFGKITWNDFLTWKIQAVITPKAWWPSFVLPIDEKWNIQIPASMKEAFNTRTFAFLEVGSVKEDGANILLNPIASIKWNWSMVFDKITDLLPWQAVETLSFSPVTPANSWDINWYWIPFGWNRYHHINKPQAKWQWAEHVYDDLYDDVWYTEDWKWQFMRNGISHRISSWVLDSKYGDFYLDVPYTESQLHGNILSTRFNWSSSEEAYIKLHWDKKLLSALSEQVPEMDKKCKISINLPAYREWKTIYKALYEYSTKQKNKDGSVLEPSTYEINVLLNRPNERVDFDAETEKEVKRFKKDYPWIKVNFIQHTFHFTGKPKMGTIYKTLADLSLYRKNQRDIWENRMLIIRNWWADAMEKNKFFLSHIFEQFENNSDVSVYKSESRYPKEVIKKLPLLHVMYTLHSGLNRLYTRWKSNIWSWSYRSDVYAFAWGFNWDLSIWEDIDLASRIRSTSKEVWKIIKKDGAKNAIDNPRRAIMSLVTWVWISHQYKDYNSENNQRAINEISSKNIDEIASMWNMIFNKENLERNLTQLYQYYLTKMRKYSSTIRKLKKDWATEAEIIDATYEGTNSLFSRMFTIMGMSDSYQFVRRTTWKNAPSDARIEITNMSVISRLMENRTFNSYNVFD